MGSHLFSNTCGVLLQVENLQPSVQGNARYRNSFEGLTVIVRNQGWRQLFAGLSINYMKVICSYILNEHTLAGFLIGASHESRLFKE